MSDEVFIFADWEQFDEPTFVGTLRSTTIKSKEHFSFTYDDAWLASEFVQQLDPDLQLYRGEQHAANSRNFRAFLDSCPDRWGRLLMKRREAVQAHQQDRRVRVLNEIDYRVFTIFTGWARFVSSGQRMDLVLITTINLQRRQLLA